MYACTCIVVCVFSTVKINCKMQTFKIIIIVPYIISFDEKKEV